MVEFKHQRQEHRGIDRFLKLQAKVSFTKHYALILQSNLRLPFFIALHCITLKLWIDFSEGETGYFVDDWAFVDD